MVDRQILQCEHRRSARFVGPVSEAPGQRRGYFRMLVPDDTERRGRTQFHLLVTDVQQ